MILYLDASALVKRYIEEPGTPEVEEAIAEAEIVGTSIISRAETSAALAKAVRSHGEAEASPVCLSTKTLTPKQAESALQVFRNEWPNLVRIQATEYLLARADALAFQIGGRVRSHALRGYDAVHLASALLWNEGMAEDVTMATFDRQLWEAAVKLGLIPFPDDLPTMLDDWKKDSS